MNEAQPIRVLCVDDSPQMTRLLERVIQLEPDMNSVGSLQSADDLASEVRRLAPNIVLLDLTMPGRDPLDVIRELSGCVPDTKVIVFSGHSDPEYEQAAISHGAWGFVLKDGGIEPIIEAIREVAKGQRVYRSRPAARPAFTPIRPAKNAQPNLRQA